MDNFCRYYQRTYIWRFAMGILLAVTIGCSESIPEDPPADRPDEPFALVDHTEWGFAESDEDPFVDRPVEVRCPTNSWGVEELDGQMTIAVTTDFCEYFTVMQPTVDDVWAGDTLSWRIFHFALESERPATAHVALRIGSQMLVDEEIEIPSESALLAGDIPASEDYAAGTPVYFHVHNHGANEYSLIELSAEAP